MDHLVILLDGDHVGPAAELAQRAAGAAGLEDMAGDPASVPHVTLVAHSGLPAARARVAIETIVADTQPFILHARGYGFFTGSDAADLSLHVPVVRNHALDRLHGRCCDALRGAGARIAGWSEPAVWSPHLTLLDRGLDAARLARAVALLAQRHHPSWRIPVDRVALTGGWSDRRRPASVLRFGS
jgi:2'-5' RNA ligase